MTRYAPDPGSRFAAVPIAADTHLFCHVHYVHGVDLWGCDNSMVITGTEPVIVAGRIADSSLWLEGVFGIVEPTDVRWVYLSADELDHAGHLADVMTACPRAVLLASPAALHRQAGRLAVPLDRCRWVDDGGSFHAGDRRLLSVRAPVCGTPGIRGLLDQRTGVYWAAETFGCLLPDQPPSTVAELDPEEWAEGMALFAHRLLAPWLDLIDHRRFAALCDRTQALGMTTIATAHSPLITDTSIDHAFQLLPRPPGDTRSTVASRG